MSREYSTMNEEKIEKRGEDEIERLDIMKIVDDAYKGLRRWWTVFLVIVSVCASLFYFQAKRSYVPVYQASTTFIVNTSTAMNYSSSYYDKSTAAQIAKTFPYIISNNALQHIIAEDLGMETIPGEITATALGDTNMITISVKSGSPEQAYGILQSVIKNYPKVARLVIGETELNVMDETGVPSRPVNAEGARSAAKKGLLVGMMVCCLWLFVYAVNRKTVQREDDLKKALNVKCLGSIPKINSKKRSSSKKNRILITNSFAPYGFTEANRTLRSRVERYTAETGAKVYMVSSALAGEGKSTVAANLALSLAGKGRRVILVDMDFRNPSVRKVLGLNSRKTGLIDVLSGNVSLNDIMISYENTGLQVLPGGSPARMAAKIVSNPRIGELFTVLRGGSDYIIVDTPPSSLLTDAAELAKYMDAGIFVVKQDYAPIERILDGIEMLTDSGLHLTGCVLNEAETGITGYGYGSYGKYGKYGKYGGKYASK